MEAVEIKIQVVGAEQARRSLQGVKTSVDTATGNITKGVFQGTLAFEALRKGIELTVGVIQTVATATIDFAKQSISAYTEVQRSLTTLGIISERFGENSDKATKAATRLGRELRIGVGPAAQGIQNLLKSGLNLDQAIDLMKRFTNEAITGKSANVSLADAVQNLSFAYATNNSAIGNLSGISENFEFITQKGRESLIKKGVAVKNITDEMAKYEGIINLTNLTLGSAEKFTGTLIDTQASLEQQIIAVQVAIGEKLAPIYNMFLQQVSKSIILLTQLGNQILSSKTFQMLSVEVTKTYEVFQKTFLPAIQRVIQMYIALTKEIIKSVEFKILIMQIKAVIIEFRTWTQTGDNAKLMMLKFQSAIAFTRGFLKSFLAALNLVIASTRIGFAVFRTVVSIFLKISNAVNQAINSVNRLKASLSGVKAPKLSFGGGGGKGFASGGIVPGNSYTGDKVISRTNSGEMILNKSQQSVLFRLLSQRQAPVQNINANFGQSQASPMQQMNTFSNLLIQSAR